MIRNSLSVSMDAALNAWALRPAPTGSISQQVAAHAVAHGVSATGLRLALLRAGMIQTSKVKAD